MGLAETFKMIEQEAQQNENVQQDNSAGIVENNQQQQAQGEQPQNTQQQTTSEQNNQADYDKLFEKLLQDVVGEDKPDPVSSLLDKMFQQQQPQQPQTNYGQLSQQTPMQQLPPNLQTNFTPQQSPVQYDQMSGQQDINAVAPLIQQVVSQQMAQLQPLFQELQRQKVELEIKELTNQFEPEIVQKYGEALINAKRSNPHIPLNQLAHLVIPPAEWEKRGAKKLWEKIKQYLPNDINPNTNENYTPSPTTQQKPGTIEEAVRLALQEIQGG